MCHDSRYIAFPQFCLLSEQAVDKLKIHLADIKNNP